MLSHSTAPFLNKFPSLMNAWNNKTDDKILTQECQETKSKLTLAYRGIR